MDMIRSWDSIFRSPVKAKWKDIPGYEKLYKVSDQGEVKSMRNKCLVAVLRGQYVNLSKNGKMEKVKICYAVARAFIRNEAMRPYVIHINGDKSDNRACNLAWSEKPEEVIRGRMCGKDSRSVICYSEEGELIGKFSSMSEGARKMGVSRQGIMRVCSGKGKRCGGYIWRYE